MSPFAKKLLTHGFQFMLGMGLLMGWNDELAVALRFPGVEVWRPLTLGGCPPHLRRFQKIAERTPGSANS
jgi:hypothetical protein